MLKKPASSLMALAILAAPLTAIAADCSATSGKQITPLLELYTSEGCSSCPPADNWLSKLSSSGFDSSKVIPLAFHVDYWDYIGWKDRFAKASYSERQRQIASNSGSTFVYTPQLLLNGRDLRGWQSGDRFSNLVQNTNKDEAKVSLKISFATDNNKSIVSVSADARPSMNISNSDLYLVVSESQLSSTVNAGENAGKELKHDYVVRELYGPYPLTQLKNKQLSRELALKAETAQANLALVAFVQTKSTNTVEQAVSLNLKGCIKQDKQ